MLNITCPVNSLGYGVVGLNLLKALEASGNEPAWWRMGPVEAPLESESLLQRAEARTLHFNPQAPSLRIFHQFDLAHGVGRGTRAAFPIFELNRFLTNEKNHLLSNDVIFSASKWGVEVLVANGVPRDRICVAPLGCDISLFSYRQEEPSSGPTVFLNIGKWEYRKGHDVLLEAFNAAFTMQDDVELWMLTQNPCMDDGYNRQWNLSYQSCGLSPKIKLIGRVRTHQEVAALMRSCHCGVFPSRAEGWNLEAAEMLAMGKPVILTRYSGHTEYATNRNSLLIDVTELEPADDGVWFASSNPNWEGKPGEWASFGMNQMDQLVAHLRWVHENRPVASQDVASSMEPFTWDRCADIICDHLRGGLAF